MARATSFTRATSSAVISSRLTATTPGEVRAATCSPAMPPVTAPPAPSATAIAGRRLAPYDHRLREAGVQLHVGASLRSQILRDQRHGPNDLRPGVASQQDVAGPQFQQHVPARRTARAGDRLKQ